MASPEGFRNSLPRFKEFFSGPKKINYHLSTLEVGINALTPEQGKCIYDSAEERLSSLEKNRAGNLFDLIVKKYGLRLESLPRERRGLEILNSVAMDLFAVTALDSTGLGSSWLANTFGEGQQVIPSDYEPLYDKDMREVVEIMYESGIITDVPRCSSNEAKQIQESAAQAIKIGKLPPVIVIPGKIEFRDVNLGLYYDLEKYKPWCDGANNYSVLALKPKRDS